MKATLVSMYLSYVEWLRCNHIVVEDETRCDDCGGTGRVVCEYCGHEVVCDECFGSGIAKEMLLKYGRQREADRKIWERWCAEDVNSE